MAIDIVGYINTAWTEGTSAEKIAMLNDLAEAFGYSAYVADGGEASKKLYVNQKIIERIKSWINGQRKNVAVAAVEIEELDGDFVAGE